jgi:hypothetical protein
MHFPGRICTDEEMSSEIHQRLWENKDHAPLKIKYNQKLINKTNCG